MPSWRVPRSRLPPCPSRRQRRRAEAISHLVPDPASLARREARVASSLAIAKGSWAGAYQLNTKEYWNLLRGDLWLIPQTLALMMIGLSLFKSGFLAGRSSSRRYGAGDRRRCVRACVDRLALLANDDPGGAGAGGERLHAPAVAAGRARLYRRSHPVASFACEQSPAASRRGRTHGLHQLSDPVSHHDLDLLRRQGRIDG